MKIAYMLGSLNRGGMETLLLDVFKNARIAEYSFIGIHRKGGNYQSEFYATQLMEQCSPRRGYRDIPRLRLWCRQMEQTTDKAQHKNGRCRVFRQQLAKRVLPKSI